MTSNHGFEAYTLLTIPNATLMTPGGPVSGDLALEYVTLPDRQTKDAAAPDVLLVLRIGSHETVLDPTQAVHSTTLLSGEQRYHLHVVNDSRDVTLVLPPAKGGQAADDLEMLHGILSAYGGFSAQEAGIASVDNTDFTLEKPAPDEDLRGRFILVNEDNNEVIGALDRNVHIQEDPTLYEKGHETDPVIVELPEGVDDLTEAQVMIRAIPEEDRGWMINGAMLATRVISGTTTLLSGAMTAASQYYINHSTPSPHALPGGASLNVPPPSRTLLMLRSPKTRENLARIHGMSGQAAKLSNKTIGLIDKAIDLLVRYDNKGKGRAVPPPPMLGPPLVDGKPPIPPRRSVSPAPPPYSADDKSPIPPARDEKPPLPPRKLSPRPDVSTSGTSPRAPSFTHPAETTGKPKGPSMKARIALSAALVLASLDTNATRLVDGGSNAIVAAVAHKHGQDAGENARIATGTARNVVLVYVDVAGMGRRAIIKRVVKKSVKSVAQRHMKLDRPASASTGKI